MELKFGPYMTDTDLFSPTNLNLKHRAFPREKVSGVMTEQTSIQEFEF